MPVRILLVKWGASRSRWVLAALRPESAMPLTAKLVVVGGDVKTAEIDLRLPSTIGRGRGATIMLAHPLVSRQHCELYEASGQLMVRDLGSLNGTFVNNQRVTESCVPPGELLTIGTVTFRAVYESESQVGPPPGPAPQMKAPRLQDTDQAGTLRAEPKAKPAAPPAAKPAPAKKPPEPASATPMTENVEEFDFGPPPQALDDEEEDAGSAEDPKTAIHGAPPPADDDEEELSPPAKGAAGKPTQPAAPKSSPDEQDTEDDEDFGDFLKSLGK